MIKIGVAGIGFMGWIHYLAYQRVAGARVVALCEQNKKRLAGDWRDIQGNFGPPGELIDVSQMHRHERLDDLFADPSVDLVDICLPPSAHANAAVQALEHGKHVLCEKPMALTVADCQRMVKAAERAKRQILIGHVLPMFPEYAHVRKLVASGKYGAAARRSLQTRDFRSPVAQGFLRSARAAAVPCWTCTFTMRISSGFCSACQPSSPARGACAGKSSSTATRCLNSTIRV